MRFMTQVQDCTGSHQDTHSLHLINRDRIRLPGFRQYFRKPLATLIGHAGCRIAIFDAMLPDEVACAGFAVLAFGAVRGGTAVDLGRGGHERVRAQEVFGCKAKVDNG